MDWSERAMYECQDCGQKTAQDGSCPYCNSKDLEDVSAED